ncbi:hypothetical protein ACJ72_08342 [Emergomyces africanus]|uniref:Uncharacterized protein n=1 Tax=Emergomyces africanus TaxID=1955775 RepID=A0A1B7NKR3_9EURO|nr:hypothetical protein ACJ72_08342 [Emergomyces africanus]
MEIPISSLSKLSPSQVEKASFIPGCFTQRAAKPRKLPSESTAEEALQALQQRLAEQDARISLLEKKLRKNRLGTAEEAEEAEKERKGSVPGAGSVPVSSANAQPAPRKDVGIGLAGPNDGDIPSMMRYQILQLKLYSIVQQRRAIAVKPSFPLSSPPQQSPASSFFDDFSPAPPKSAPPDQAYSPDDLRAFESYLEMKAASSVNNHNNGVHKETIRTLLEGIESPVDVPHAFKTEPKCLLPVNAIPFPVFRIIPRLRANYYFTVQSIDAAARTTSSSQPTPLPWDGEIKYTLPTSSPFDDSNQASRALSAQRHQGSLLGLFQHGLIFHPPESEGNVYRTVAITNLPLRSCLRHLFQAVRGGPVFSAHLMNMERVAGHHMGIVNFLYERDARAYVAFSQSHGVFFDDRRANVIMFKQATYPISVDMEQKVRGNHTRCISIKGPPDSKRYTDVATFVEKQFPVYFDLGDDMVENASATDLEMHFNSIEAASAVIGAFRQYHRLANCELSFAPDPCSRPLPTCPCH